MASLPRVLRSLSLVATLLPLVQACGRSEPGDYLYTADGSISTGATSSSSGGRGSGTGGTRSSGGSATGTAGRPTGGTGAGGSSVGVGGELGFGGDSGGTGVGGAGVAGTGGTGTVVPITCGDDVCNTPNEKCCAGFGGFACVPSAQTCSGAVLGCTLNADCNADQVCCLSITGDPLAASACKDSCSRGSGTRDRQLCETAADCRMPFRYCTATVFGVSVCTRTGPGQ